MKLLVIGGCHTYGFGVAFRQGFVQQVAAALRESAIEVTIDYYSPAKMNRIGPLLATLGHRLRQYDLILLQPGHFELIHTHFQDLFRPVPAALNPTVYGGHSIPDHPCRPTPTHVVPETLWKSADESVETYVVPRNLTDRLRRWVKQQLVFWAHRLWRVERLAYMEHLLTDALAHLQPYRNRVILVTPMPVRDPFLCALRRMARQLFISVGKEAGVQVVDSFASVRMPETAFLADGCHLNSFGHTQLADAVLLACRRMGLQHRHRPETVLERGMAYTQE